MRRSLGSGLVRLSFVVGTLAFSPRVAAADGPSIVVEIGGLRSDRGEVRGALFRSRGWASEGSEIATCVATIENHRAVCVIDDVEPGAYAFAFLHDEDEDGALDRDWIGIPSEGFGFSNDAAPVFGPPSYESARFTHDDGVTTLHVGTRYGL
jgi:uncharacterized protein (DUF2141 family)